MFPRVTDSCEVAVEDDILPSDDDISSSDRETEQNEVASDENIVSGTGSDDDWISIVRVSHELKRYFAHWTLQYFYVFLAMGWPYLLYVWILQFIY